MPTLKLDIVERGLFVMVRVGPTRRRFVELKTSGNVIKGYPSRDIFLQVDTGADRSMVDLKILDELQINPHAAEVNVWSPFLSSAVQHRLYEIKMDIRFDGGVFSRDTIEVVGVREP